MLIYGAVPSGERQGRKACLEASRKLDRKPSTVVMKNSLQWSDGITYYRQIAVNTQHSRNNVTSSQQYELHELGPIIILP